jgi:hypothetical protein
MQTILVPLTSRVAIASRAAAVCCNAPKPCLRNSCASMAETASSNGGPGRPSRGSELHAATRNSDVNDANSV